MAPRYISVGGITPELPGYSRVWNGSLGRNEKPTCFIVVVRYLGDMGGAHADGVDESTTQSRLHAGGPIGMLVGGILCSGVSLGLLSVPSLGLGVTIGGVALHAAIQISVGALGIVALVTGVETIRRETVYGEWTRPREWLAEVSVFAGYYIAFVWIFGLCDVLLIKQQTVFSVQAAVVTSVVVGWGGLVGFILWQGWPWTHRVWQDG